MIVPCEGGNCGGNAALDSAPLPTSVEQQTYTPLSNIPYYGMTSVASPQVPGTSNVPTYSGIVATEPTYTTGNVPERPVDLNNMQASRPMNVNWTGGNAPAAGTSAGNFPTQEEVFSNAPTFTVPTNPLLPPGYQEVLDYGNLQYMNGFLRTQIGKYVRVQQLVGSNVIEERYGYLVGVGINYILLQEISTGNILVLDFWNIKYVYIYYTKTDLPTNEIR